VPSATADDDAIGDIEWLKKFILGVRQIRGEMDIAPGKPLPVLLHNASDEDARRADELMSLLERVGKVESVTRLGNGEEPPASATALLDEMRLLVPMKGLIDIDAERGRLGKQLDKVETDLKRSQGKLSNDKFVNNAPADVVTQERQRVVEFERQITQLTEQLQKLDELR
jgi:valyl-tRNA synthetase